MPLSSSRVRASFFWPQFVFGLLHLALSSPMIYLALGLPLLMRQHGWSGLEIGLFQLAGVPAVFKLLLAAPIERAPDERATPAYQARRYRAWSLALGACYGAALLALAGVSIHSARAVLFALLLACVLLATWADVPVSALQIHVLPPAERARAGGVRSAAMFGAAVLGGGVMLVLSQRLGWSAPFYGMAGLLALALALLPTLRMDGAGEDDGGARPSAEAGMGHEITRARAAYGLRQKQGCRHRPPRGLRCCAAFWRSRAPGAGWRCCRGVFLLSVQLGFT